MHSATHWRKYINFEQFESNLLEASHIAFSAVQNDHLNETFYVFALYKEPLLGYILPTSNSEEGLEKIVDNDKCAYVANKQKYNRKTLLRWEFPPDWPYHLYAQEAFRSINNQLSQVYHLIDELSKDDRIQFLNHAHEVMCRVLTRLDNEGLFGTGVHRNKVIINIMMGDEDYGSRLGNAQRLNPSDAYTWYKADLEKLYPSRQSFISRLLSRS